MTEPHNQSQVAESSNESIIAVSYREALRLAKQNHGMKFIHVKFGTVYSLTNLRNVTKGRLGRNSELIKSFDEKLYMSFIPIKKQKPIKRWDDYTKQWRKHSFECEYAVGDDCTCWCGEVWHNAQGQNLDFKPQIKISEEIIQESHC